MISDKDLEILNSDRALRFLVKQKEPDFEKILAQLNYEKKLRKLQIELLKIQKWVVDSNARIIILLEGREFAGKGSLIRTFTEHLNPRSYRVVALPSPNAKEQGEWYFQRYIRKLPAQGELVFFDRSWYNRAIVEPVNKFCNKQEYEQFMNNVNAFEEILSHDGIKIIKLYVSISKQEQKDRIKSARKNPLRKGEISDVDENAVKLWDKYTEYKEKMFDKTSTELVPWHVIHGDNKRQFRLNGLKVLLDCLKYEK